MKKIRILILAFISLISFSLVSNVNAEIIGDNYPTVWRNAPQDTVYDSWGMLNRECTSFVAYRLSSKNGFNLPAGYRDAGTWANIARSQGYTVNNIPAVGSVACFAPFVTGAGEIGHVAWVAEVSGDMITIEEYNCNTGQGPYKYGTRKMNKSSVSSYIHFKDVSSVPSNPTPTPIPTSFSVGDTIKFSYAYKVSGYSLPNILSSELAGNTPLDPSTFDESNSSGAPSGDGILHIGEYFIIPGEFKILAVDESKQMILVNINGKQVWVFMNKVTKIASVTPTNEIKVGSTIKFSSAYKVSGYSLPNILSSELAGNTPLDPSTFDESNASGIPSGDGILHIGEYFIIPGNFQVLAIDNTSKKIQVNISGKLVWVYINKVTLV